MEVFILDKQSAKKQGEQRTLVARSLLTGFIGGMISGSFWVIMYYLNFTEISLRSILVRPFSNASWTNGWIGDIVSIIVFGVLSLLIAYIYYLALKKLLSIWISIIFGIGLWLIFFYLLLPIIPNIRAVVEFNARTTVTTLCLFILYGTFIGYSISYDYYDTMISNKIKKSK